MRNSQNVSHNAASQSITSHNALQDTQEAHTATVDADPIPYTYISLEEYTARQVEALAQYAHHAWADYIGYFLNKLEKNDAGDLIIRARYVEHLHTQVITPYAFLSEPEKDLDRAEARRILETLADVMRV